MLKLDNSLLDELGLGNLPEEQKRAMLQHIYETLELRVGTNLANQMTDAQLDEFEKFIDEGGDANQAQALQWLETNLPNYKQVVNEVFEALKGEVRQMAPQIAAASGVQLSSGPTIPAVPAPGAQGPAAPAQASFGAGASASSFNAPVGPAPAAPAAPAYGPAPTAPAYGPGTPQSFAPAPAAPTYGAPAPAAPAMDQPTAPPAPAAPSYGAPAAPAGQSMGGQDSMQSNAPAPDYTQPSVPAPAQPPSDDVPFPSQQPPAGPGNFPPQHSGQ